MGACVWTKENKTSLHNIVKATASMVPRAAGLMVYMDDLFGYSLKPEKVRDEWWNMNLPHRGLDT